MTQPDLFAPAVRWQAVDDPERARIWLRRDFLAPAEARELFEGLHATIPWRSDELRVFGKTHPIPRLHQWYADDARSYEWSGVRMRALAWTPRLDALRRQVESATRRSFNSVLLNLYRDGRDTVGWHADDEPELGAAPFIASVSLGAERDFALRRNTPRGDPHDRITLALPPGSLLVMSEGVQAAWQHSLPRRKGVARPRINLTFRHTA